MSVRLQRSMVHLGLLLALLLAVAPAAAAQDPHYFKLVLTGMVGFVPRSDGTLDALLVNELSKIADKDHAVTHFPLLGLQCKDLADPQVQQECRWWPADYARIFRQVALDNYDPKDAKYHGFEVRIRVGGEIPTGPVNRGTHFDDYVIHLSDLKQGDASRAKLRPDAMTPATAADHALARIELAGGEISAEESQTGSWHFRSGGFDHFQQKVAKDATWTIEYDPGRGATIELWPLGGAAPSRVFYLESKGDLVVVLSNEPDPLEYCMHAPTDRTTPSFHFVGFLDLTEYAVTNNVDALKKLPLPYPEDPGLQCLMDRKITGRRVDCMMVLFEQY